MDDVRYQVFVSSTFSDLKNEREKVLQAILQLEAFPAGMELFPAADEDQLEFIKREIASSDYYIVIIAGRYGSMTASGISYTESEFDYARSIGKPVLAFIIRDIAKLTGENLEQSDDLREKLRLFTDKAKKSRVVNFWSNPDELKSTVLHSLPVQFKLKPMRGWVRAGQPRREDLEKLNLLLEQNAQLQVENADLKRLASHVELLASGSEPIALELNIADLTVNQLYPTTRELRIDTTWDEMLNTMFRDSGSNATERELKQHLLTFIIDYLPEDAAAPGWFSGIREYVKKGTHYNNHSALNTMIPLLLRQFTGLNYIRESIQTMPVRDHMGKHSQESMRVWTLTPEGARHLALIFGTKSAVDL